MADIAARGDIEEPGCEDGGRWGQGAARWPGLVVVGLVFVLAAAWSWRKWPDILVDFGTQLYIPWRLAEGAVLYRDLYYFAGGPLSQYYHALLFQVFGVSFLTLIVSNLVLVGASLALIYRQFAAAAEAGTATIICLGIILAFAFDQYNPVGNYNYIAPYSHEALHGLLLSILAVMWLSDWVNRGRLRSAFGSGFCAGLVFLTKPDIFAAVTAVAIAAWVLRCLARGQGIFMVKSLLLFLLAGIIPVLGFFLYFLNVEDWRLSLRSVLFAWVPLFHTSITKSPFYQWCLGFDRPAFYLQKMAVHFLFVVLVMAFYAVALRFVGKLKFKRAKTKWLVVFALMIPLFVFACRFDWADCGASLPLWSLFACVTLCWNYRTWSKERNLVFPLLWNVLGLTLLLKLGLHPRIGHYGFVLAMPAFVGTVYLFLRLLPKLLEDKCDVPATFFRVTVGLVLLAGFGRLFNFSASIYDLKKLPVGRGHDLIYAYGPSLGPGEIFQAALDWIETNTPPTATLAVVPEGTTINYLTRRVNPTPCLFWDPNVMALFGQANMTARFEENAPDYICIVERSIPEHGVGYFGHYPGFGVDLMQWIEKNYEPVCLIGNEPLKNGLFGVKILKKLPAPMTGR